MTTALLLVSPSASIGVRAVPEHHHRHRHHHHHHHGGRLLHTFKFKTTPVLTKNSSYSPISATANGITTRGNTDITAATEVEEDPYFRAGLRRDLMPRHVAVNMDGNRRWAKARGREIDYKLFYKANVLVAELCVKWGIPTVFCYLFSTENWKRTKEANDLFFSQFQESLEENIENYVRQGMKVTIIGQKWRLSKSLQETIIRVEEATKEGTKLELMYGASYGGRWDVVEATRSICEKIKLGLIEPEDINEGLVDQNLSTANSVFPNPDIMIRAGGVQRLSNFMHWQLADTELYFPNILGPDFTEEHFIDALRFYQQSKI